MRQERSGKLSVNSLGFALLGLLARERLSGYDLKRRMGREVGNFWSASHGQIYPELARLEGDGMVSHELVEQRDRPDKKVYEITPAGLAALGEWVTAPVEPRVTRDELVLKAYSMWLAKPEEALALFGEHERLHEERLARYEEIGAWMEAEWGDDLDRLDSPRFASYATLMRGIMHERGYAEWCRWLAGRISARLERRERAPENG